MNKYFKNDKKLTVEDILKTYENYDWGFFPQLLTKKAQAQKLMRQCLQSDEYLNWSAAVKKVKQQMIQAKQELQQVQRHKTQILLKNSQEEYDKVLKELQDRYYKLVSNQIGLSSNPPKSKWAHFKAIEDSIKKGQNKAREELEKDLQQRRARCHCTGDYCQC